MNPVETPEILAQQSALVQMILWIGGGLGGLIVVGLSWTIRVLWNHNKELRIEIKELQTGQTTNEKENLKLFGEIVNAQASFGKDVSKIQEAMDVVKPHVGDIREDVKELIRTKPKCNE